MKVLSLFTGAGGFDLGLEMAGFEVVGCVEKDRDAIATVQHNRPSWRCIKPGDIHLYHPQQLMQWFGIRTGELSLLAAGPPCQPFSKSGYWARGTTGRLADPRSNTLSALIELLEVCLPEMVLVENVKGISYRGRNEGIVLIETGLDRINKIHGVSYRLQVLHLNAASFGVPQIRERTFLFAHRSGLQLQEPKATHVDQTSSPSVLGRRFNTAWDAIGHLDSLPFDDTLRPRGKWADLLSSIPEGHNYLWHTERGGGDPLFGWRTRYWTFLLKLAKSRPSWTLQAEPGPATGPFHWRNRLLSIEELCRLQTFPNDYILCGSYSSARRQIGNAVPSALGELLGREMMRQFFAKPLDSSLTLIPQQRFDCPAAEPVSPAPAKYAEFQGVYRAHPGPGLGPRSQRLASTLDN